MASSQVFRLRAAAALLLLFLAALGTAFVLPLPGSSTSTSSSRAVAGAGRIAEQWGLAQSRAATTTTTALWAKKNKESDVIEVRAHACTGACVRTRQGGMGCLKHSARG